MREDGVVAKLSLYPQAIHGFFLMAGELDAGKKCIDEVATTLRNAFNSTPTGSHRLFSKERTPVYSKKLACNRRCHCLTSRTTP